MKCRIIKPRDCNMYFGEVYKEYDDTWGIVTSACFTKWGTKLELKKYKKRKNYVSEEFEI